MEIVKKKKNFFFAYTLLLFFFFLFFFLFFVFFLHQEGYLTKISLHLSCSKVSNAAVVEVVLRHISLCCRFLVAYSEGIGGA